MVIKHLSYRVEFQGRGAAHIHGVLWLNIKEMEKSEIFKEKGIDNEILSEAFKKLRDDVKLTEDEKEAIVILTDMFVSCSLNPDTIHENKELGKKLVEIIKSVNCHNCTRPCEKYGDKCKYGYPKFPLKKTLFIDKHGTSELTKNDENEKTNYKKILIDVEEVIKDDEKVKEIMDRYEQGLRRTRKLRQCTS